MKKLLSLLLACIILLVSLGGCAEKPLPKEMPEDFSFTLTFGTYGFSSYDSRTGKLVKTTQTSKPKDYITYYRLSEEELEWVYSLIQKLRVDSYPDEYDPDPFTATTPCTSLILTVRTGNYVKTVTADDVTISSEFFFPKGSRFIETCNAISDFLTSTEEWKALPDHEFFYD